MNKYIKDFTDRVFLKVSSINKEIRKYKKKGLLGCKREFLGEHYFKELALLKNIGCTHIVFWFDN